MPSRALRTTSTDSAYQAPALGSRAPGLRDGFSIIELLVVLVIVGIMAMTIAPSMSEVLSGNRHANAAMELVKFARATRSAAVSSGAAQLMRFIPGPSELGVIERYVGLNNRCLQSRWDIAMGSDPGQGARRAWAFDMAQYNPGAVSTADDSGQQIIKMGAMYAGKNDPLKDLWLCYQPDGQVYSKDEGVASLAVQSRDVEFTISRSIGGEKHGADRKVLFPAGGNARLE